MSVEAKERAGDKLAALSRRGLDLAAFWRQATEIVSKAVRHRETPCWYTFDPASLLITSHFHEGLPGIPCRWLAAGLYQDDARKIADVARSKQGITAQHEAMGGHPPQSQRRHHDVAYGTDQELIAGLRTRDGAVWGALALYRARGDRLFDHDDLAFIKSVSGHLAEGARRALLTGTTAGREWPDVPGLIVLSGKGQVESSTPGVHEWLDELPDGDWSAGRLPSSVLAVAARAVQSALSRAPAEPPFARVLSRSGTWIVLHGAPLSAEGPPRVAVIVELAHPARISPLLMSAYGLTERERDITCLVLRGYSTTEIAQELTVSAQTVQQHLKSVFEKTGVRSRRDLMGKVFFSHYEPRVRDGELRAARHPPLRGAPISSH